MANERDPIYRLRRSIQCEECDAAAVIAAAERSGHVAGLKAIAADYHTDGAERAATLTTVVIDDGGDYVLENERSRECGDRSRLCTRPARITFLVHGRGAGSEPAALAIPAEMAFGSDDAAILNDEWMQPLIAADVTDAERVLAIVTTALFVPNDRNDAGEKTRFVAKARERIAEAMQPEATERLVVEIDGRVEVVEESKVEANFEARTSRHESGIVTRATTASRHAAAAAEHAAGSAVRETPDELHNKRARADRLGAADDNDNGTT